MNIVPFYINYLADFLGANGAAMNTAADSALTISLFLPKERLDFLPHCPKPKRGFIGLLNFTDKGLHGVKDTTRRAAAAKEMAKKLGVNMREVYWMLGEYDVVCVLEADDESAVTAFNLATAMQGNVRSQTLRAFSSGEMDKIIARLP